MRHSASQQNSGESAEVVGLRKAMLKLQLENLRMKAQAEKKAQAEQAEVVPQPPTQAEALPSASKKRSAEAALVDPSQQETQVQATEVEATEVEATKVEVTQPDLAQEIADLEMEGEEEEEAEDDEEVAVDPDGTAVDVKMEARAEERDAQLAVEEAMKRLKEIQAREKLKKKQPILLDELEPEESTTASSAQPPAPEQILAENPAVAAPTRINTSTHKIAWGKLERLMVSSKAAEYPHMKSLFDSNKSAARARVAFERSSPET